MRDVSSHLHKTRCTLQQASHWYSKWGFFWIPNSEPCVVKNVKSCHKILGTDKLQQMAQTMDGETYGENKTLIIISDYQPKTQSVSTQTLSWQLQQFFLSGLCEVDVGGGLNHSITSYAILGSAVLCTLTGVPQSSSWTTQHKQYYLIQCL